MDEQYRLINTIDLSEAEIHESLCKLREVELDILSLFIRICEDNDLKYYASGGTLLGTIRHNGFIPWDDDIDIMMPFSDYKRFLCIAKKELKEPYFLQSYMTEIGYLPRYSRIRRSDTTGYTVNDEHYPSFNKGIFIDIFPYFNISGSNIFLFIQRVLIAICSVPMIGRDTLIKKT